MADFRVYDLADEVEAFFWQKLREKYPEHAEREGTPDTWSDNPKFSHEVSAGAPIRDAAAEMAKRWIVCWENDRCLF